MAKSETFKIDQTTDILAENTQSLEQKSKSKKHESITSN